MDFENNLKFQYLAGGSILEYPPIYSRNGEHLLFMTKNDVNVYSTISYQFVRKLEGSTAPLIDFEFELQNDNILIACNNRGEIFSWEWKTGVLKNILHIPAFDNKPWVTTNFKLLNIYGKSDLSHAFVCFKITNEAMQWRILSRENKSFIEVPCNLKLQMRRPLVAVDNKNFPNLVLAQGYFAHFVDYKTWKCTRWDNAYKVPITALQMHTSEECVATGDERGKIFLWREFYDKETVKNSLYHWHHTKVTSISFTIAGASFYSSGEESVIVKWNIENPEIRQFIPRTAAEIRHIVISPDNTRVVACLNDNSIQFYGTERVLHQNLQEFTYIADDKAGSYKYPAGLRLNPRNNSLVLNGRIGSLQFYNTYTKSLLYNVNIVNQNLLSKERDKILYNINVTKAAFNIDWMATGEVFNDEEHLPELRLKFWKYQEDSQNYALNTNIELPHEGGFKAIEFSNDYQVENLLCATVGEDNIVKIWSLEDSDNIYKKGKTWYCIAQTSYKNLPIASISFSQDGSLLAAGFGNTLCIYKSNNLKIKAALTGSSGLDGCVTKAQIKLPTKTINGAKSELVETRKKLMLSFTKLLDANEETFIKEWRKALNCKKSLKNDAAKTLKQLDDQQKTTLYKRISQMQELNLFQKFLLYQRLGIACKVHPQMETKLAEYLGKLFAKRNTEEKLFLQISRFNLRQRFKAKYRLQQHRKQQMQYYNRVTTFLVPLLNLLNLGNNKENKKTPQNDAKSKQNVNKIVEKNLLLPNPTMAEISHVQFAAGEYAHLVVVCTERRILIWNLLTLRLQAVLKLSVQHLTFDALTNLVAVVTQNNELHVFQPNVPLPIFQRRNIPNVHDIAWIPRRYPKQRSINVDWQSQSILYFLNENQEIIYLSSPHDKDADVPAPVAFENFAEETLHYTTFGTYATKTVTDKQTVSRQNGPLVLGNNDKTAVKALIDMSVHTMPPMSFICEDFVKSMVKCCDLKTIDNISNHNNLGEDNLATRLNGDVNGFASHSDDEDEENGDAAVPIGKIRKELINRTEELKRKPPANHKEEESKLRCMARQIINIDF